MTNTQARREAIAEIIWKGVHEQSFFIPTEVLNSTADALESLFLTWLEEDLEKLTVQGYICAVCQNTRRYLGMDGKYCIACRSFHKPSPPQENGGSGSAGGNGDATQHLIEMNARNISSQEITCLSLDCPERTGGKCNAREQIEGNNWEKGLTKLDFTNRIDIAEWTELVNFIKSLLLKERQELVGNIKTWAKKQNNDSDLVATSDLLRFLVSLTKDEEKRNE